MYDSVEVTRTLLSVPAGDAHAVCRALAFGNRLDTALLQPGTHHLADLFARQASGGRFVPLRHTQPGARYAAMMVQLGKAVDAAGTTMAAEWWSFDYGDAVHAHVTLYRPSMKRRHIPLSITSSRDIVGTTSRMFRNNGAASRTDRMRHARLYRTDYIFGDDAAPLVDSAVLAASAHANGAFAGTRVRVVSGPPIDSPAWQTPPVPLATDFAADAADPTGLIRAEYQMTRNI